MPQKYKFKLFLSHNRKQKDWVRELVRRLRNAGVKVFFDEDSIKKGEDIVTAVENGIMSSRHIVLIITPSSLASTWVTMETASSIYTDPSAAKRRLIPVILEPVEQEKIRLSVRKLNPTDLTDPNTREREFASLWRDLKLPQGQTPDPPAWPRQRKKKRQLVNLPPEKAKATSKKPKLPQTIKGKDGKLMVFVKGSHFRMGSGGRDEYLGDFYIDKYPVTNVEYKRFLVAIKRRAARGWGGPNYSRNKGDHPVNGITYSDAKVYAEWARKRLPTEKEWEKAARGHDGRKYPWGNKFDKAKCNTLENGIRDTTSVKKHHQGMSPYGVMDMAGNVWEWVDTWARDGDKKAKGGSYKLGQDAAICSNSESYTISSGRVSDLGFRCVKDIN